MVEFVVKGVKMFNPVFDSLKHLCNSSMENQELCLFSLTSIYPTKHKWRADRVDLSPISGYFSAQIALEKYISQIVLCFAIFKEDFENNLNLTSSGQRQGKKDMFAKEGTSF